MTYGNLFYVRVSFQQQGKTITGIVACYASTTDPSKGYCIQPDGTDNYESYVIKQLDELTLIGLIDENYRYP